ncbi:Uncharacterized integral membrane, glycosyltransferase [Citrifermentans bremense]|uniref:Uncharacterized integral membrane, glycosyltransferase n=1 Tax=Citrifermentans bremense TaxID=60035 RepID=A0A6S6M3P5_9BACT|nr:glycosyltransferase family 39 protein [Citrifermentans bremense]BCG49007.1 Uncharacterized integral membrane, glycosyltransferase [Citrifermentans bremense]
MSQTPQAKGLWLPFLILAGTCLLFSLVLPFFPVDETRYLSVAWEMKVHDSFIVPIQNALPYSHKPPLLFWLINLDWLLFGVNEGTLRFIPLIFSLFNVCLVYRIALQLWEDRKLALNAAVILGSTFAYLLWSSIIMFDVLLSFWVLIAVSALIRAGKEGRFGPFALAGVAIGGGILTKGPVVLVYILPVALFAFWWRPRGEVTPRWYAWTFLSLLIGIAVVLVWLIPAALTGGEVYRKAILWGQTVNRMANSFAHKRPLWWYFQWVPVLLAPWIFFAPFWRGCRRLTLDAGTKLVLTWIAGGFVVFSLLSGKQVHYLIPLIPACSLLMAKAVSCCEESGRRFQLPIAAFYLLVGAAIMTLTFLKQGRALHSFDLGELRIAAGGLLLLGAALSFPKPRDTSAALKLVAASTLPFVALVVVGCHTFSGRYDIHAVSAAVLKKQQEGYQVLHQGKYHGQYHFMGRLQQPLLELEGSDEIRRYAQTHEKVALVTYPREDQAVPPDEAFFRQPFRSKQVVLWNSRGILQNLEGAKAAVSTAQGE